MLFPTIPPSLTVGADRCVCPYLPVGAFNVVVISAANAINGVPTQT